MYILYTNNRIYAIPYLDKNSPKGDDLTQKIEQQSIDFLCLFVLYPVGCIFEHDELAVHAQIAARRSHLAAEGGILSTPNN